MLHRWSAAYYALWEPYRIIVGETGMRWVARRRETVVPWSALEAVEVRHGIGNASLRWWRKWRSVTTPSGFADVHRLLTDIEQRAPHVKVDS